MKILLAPDSFKGSMSAQVVVDELESILGTNEIIKKPLADGGEGSLETLQSELNLEKVFFESLDSYQNSTESYYLFDKESQKAYIESALICGIEGIPEADLKIMESSSIGIGIAIKHAIARGAKELYLFLGGTATNDGGIGILKGLDYQLFDATGQELKGKTKDLGELDKIVPPKEEYTLEQVHLISDVTNPLLGEDGASYVYGKQKGGSDVQLDEIEQSMIKYEQIISNYFNKKMSQKQSAGAAGGIAYLLLNLFTARVESGIEFFIDILNLESKIKEVDLVITGEGKIDQQSFHGKTISKVIDLCKKHQKNYLLVCGVNELPLERLNADRYFKGILEMSKEAKNLEESIKEGPKVLRKTVLNSDLEWLFGVE